MCSVLITGANRGIGIGLVKTLLANHSFKVENIFATCRDKEKAKVIILTRRDGSHYKIILFM